jgi:hypothetical protein
VVNGADMGALDCYWLAQWYHQSPEHFLAMPLSQIHLHMTRTQQIAELRAQQQGDSDGD